MTRLPAGEKADTDRPARRRDGSLKTQATYSFVQINSAVFRIESRIGYQRVGNRPGFDGHGGPYRCSNGYRSWKSPLNLLALFAMARRQRHGHCYECCQQ